MSILVLGMHHKAYVYVWRKQKNKTHSHSHYVIDSVRELRPFFK